MFGLFKRKPEKPVSDSTVDANKVIAGANQIISELGKLMEKYPTEILDTSRLPASKDEVKFALKLAYRLARSDQERNLMGAGYLYLAHFRDGVGPNPISTMLPDLPIPTTKEAMRTLAAASQVQVTWLNLLNEETQRLATEFAEFKRGQDKL